MPDTEALRLAIQDLFPTSANPRFTRVPDGVKPPWTAVSISLPSPSTRAMNTRVLSQRVTIRARVVGANDLAARQIGQMVIDALEGSRPVAAGWQPAPVQLVNTNPTPYEDTTVTLTATNAHPVILPLDFDFYATAKETP